MTTTELPSIATPMMQQWAQCKRDSEGAILLFRMGEFYEAFHEDAVILSQELSVTLTKRQGTPMAGVPAQSLENALDKLSIKGLKVAIADQMEDPKKAKGLVQRQVVRIITPGTFTPSDDSGRSHSWVMSLLQAHDLAIAICDVSTSELSTCSLASMNELESEICRLRPKEVIASSKTVEMLPQLREVVENVHGFLTIVEPSNFDLERSQTRLQKHFQVHSMASFGLQEMPSCLRCVGALMSYLQDHLRLPLNGLRSIQMLPKEGILQMDRNSQRNLELTQPLFEGQSANTLLYHLNKTLTPMGSRLMQQWLLRPLSAKAPIEARHQAIEEVLTPSSSMAQIRMGLSQVRDLQRLAVKLAAMNISPRELAALRASLGALPTLSAEVGILQASLWKNITQKLSPIPQAYDLLHLALCEEPAIRVGEGPVIRSGYLASLDELRALRQESQTWMNQYQNDLKEKLGIKTLKVGYTPAFGYYIEVSKGQSALMPASFTRRQTLVNAERYLSPELKEFEDKVLHAQERMEAIEKEELFKICQALQPHCQTLEICAQGVAECDCLLALAEVAKTYQYTKPIIDESDTLEIVGGRHPIVERMIGQEKFIANDTHLGSMSLDAHSTRMMILTGPNMAGKSTYIRQVALLVLMAQMGSFVPATKMHVGLVDRIFTRVGASDDLARGQSTFMVEMTETANILHHATSRSLVILDEVGRGTSTYDGIAIARAIAEFLLTQKGKMAKTLFATHYSELTDLPKLFPQARNYQVMVKEWHDDIVFMHQIQEGAADRSYGIHVARLAGLPAQVIKRAQAIQSHLETPKSQAKGSKSHDQLELFSLQVPPTIDPRISSLEASLSQINLNETTPIQAFMHLQEILKLWRPSK